ncbi:zinc finger protein 83-like [Polypterus senegalus]|uniref:zinc finger protein 83-like n=1 Tax=Polypterus senegalus TaxID=55291 RepID=UPI001965D299|nr:zinc finger protein 83-like [Polypterus senegalus]
MDVKEETFEADMNIMEERTINVKEEDCELECVHPKQESLDIKEEDRELGSVCFKEEDEEECISTKINNCRSMESIKEDDLHYGHQDGAVTGLVSSHSRHSSFLESSINLKYESLQSDTKMTEEISSPTTEEGHPLPKTDTKEEDRELGSVIMKEEDEEKCVSTEMARYRSMESVEEDDLHYGHQDGAVTGLVSSHSIHSSSPESSINVKYESLQSDTKMTEEISSPTTEEGHPPPKTDIKEEDCELGSVCFKEEDEEECVSTEMASYRSMESVEEDDVHYEYQDGAVTGLVSSHSRHSSSPESSISVQYESLQSDTKMTEENSSPRTEEGQPPPKMSSETKKKKKMPKMYPAGQKSLQKECQREEDVIEKRNKRKGRTNIQRPHKIINRIKVKDCNPQYMDPDEDLNRLGSSLGRRCSLKDSNAHKPSESSKTNTVSPEKKLCPNQTGEDFQENDNLSSLQDRPQIKQPDKNRKKLASATKNLVTASQHPRFQPIVKLTRIDAIKSQGAYNINPIHQQCVGTFKYKLNSKDNGEIHGSNKPYHCPEGGKQFSDSHMPKKRREDNTGKEQCHHSKCVKNFSKNSNTTTPIVEKPYLSKRGKRFSQVSHLQTHMIGHEGHCLCRCPTCGKHFFDRSSLCRHKRIHTGEKPYCCSKCGKRFSQSSYLQEHMRVHTGEQPFSCSECGKRFSQAGHLQTHMRVHKIFRNKQSSASFRSPQ